jgi:hypothetical protein
MSDVLDSGLDGVSFSRGDHACAVYFGEIERDSDGPGGYHRVRVIAEMTWVLRQPAGADQLMDYESEVNRFAPRFPQVLLCLYDIAQFGGGIILDLLRTHPKVLLGGTLIDNPNFLTPDEYRATRS